MHFFSPCVLHARRTHPYLCHCSNNILHGVEIILHHRALTMVNDSLTHSPFLGLCPSSKFKKMKQSRLPKRRVFLKFRRRSKSNKKEIVSVRKLFSSWWSSWIYLDFFSLSAKYLPHLPVLEHPFSCVLPTMCDLHPCNTTRDCALSNPHRWQCCLYPHQPSLMQELKVVPVLALQSAGLPPQPNLRSIGAGR
jgi:hypothetical protein